MSFRGRPPGGRVEESPEVGDRLACQHSPVGGDPSTSLGMTECLGGWAEIPKSEFRLPNSLLAQTYQFPIILNDFCRMRLRIDVRIGLEDDAVAVNEVRDPFGERHQRTRRPDGFGQLVVAVREQPEREVVLLRELPVLLRAVVGNTEDLNSEL